MNERHDPCPHGTHGRERLPIRYKVRMFGDYQQPRKQMRQSTRLEVGRARWCIVRTADPRPIARLGPQEGVLF